MYIDVRSTNIRIRDYFIKNFAVFIVLFTVILLNLLVSLNQHDDLAFQTMTQKYTFFNFLKDRYFHWSSRLIIESTIYFFVNHTVFWRIINIIVTFLGILIPYKVLKEGQTFENGRTSNLILLSFFSLFLLLSVTMFSGTGWISTTANYWWAIVSAEIALIPVCYKKYNRHPPLYISILSPLFLLYAANQEQVSFITISLLLLSMLYFLFYSKVSVLHLKFISLEILINLASIAFVLTCPGNYVRKISETNHSFPEFKYFSIFRKLDIGVTSTFLNIFTKFNLIFIIFVLIIFIIHVQTKLYRFIVIDIALVFFNVSTSHLFQLLDFNTFTTLFNNNGSIAKFDNPKTWGATITLICLLISFYIGLTVIFRVMHEKLLVGLIVSIAITSRIIMGLTPTVWVSGDRTFLPMYFVLIIIMSYIFAKFKSSTYVVIIMYLLIGIGFSRMLILFSVINMY